MAKHLITEGEDFEIEQVDRGFGGKRRTIMRVSGRDGTVVFGNLRMDAKGVVSINQGDPGNPSLVVENYKVDEGDVFFLLTFPPHAAVIFSVNGQQQRPDLDFSVDGQTVSWVSTDFSLADGDQVQIQYTV